MLGEYRMINIVMCRKQTSRWDAPQTEPLIAYSNIILGQLMAAGLWRSPDDRAWTAETIGL